mgnify:CR=1 FL=1
MVPIGSKIERNCFCVKGSKFIKLECPLHTRATHQLTSQAGLAVLHLTESRVVAIPQEVVAHEGGVDECLRAGGCKMMH